MNRRILMCVVLFLQVLAWPHLARAETGVEKSRILIGMSSELSGQAIAREGLDSAQAYFAHVNKRGGVFGRQIELKAYDDGRDTEKTAENTVRLITQDKVFALFGYRSTPNIEAAIPIATRHGVPFMGLFSGASSIRTPFSPVVFHLRASYQREVAAIIDHLAVMRIGRVAVLYQDDSFGKDVLEGVKNALGTHQLTAVAAASYSRKDLQVEAASKALADASPAAIIMACTPKACTDFIQKTKARLKGAQYYLLSNVNSKEFAASLAQDRDGVVVAQVVPSPSNAILPLAREYREVMAQAGNALATGYAGFEAFIAAKLLVAALERTGPDVTRSRFLTTLDSMREVDLGGMFIRFTPSNHQGSSLVELTMINRDGKYVR